MTFISIDYNDGAKKNLGYKSVNISYGNNIEKKFDSGDLIKDWYAMRKFISMDLPENETVYVTHSSSVDHFIMDGAPYDSAYLHIEDDKPVLKYINKEEPFYLFKYKDIYEKGIEFFVKENTQPTWEELKEYCKS